MARRAHSPLVALLALCAGMMLLAACAATRVQQPAATPRSDGIHAAASSSFSAPPPPPPTPTPEWVSLPPFPAQFTADYHRVELYFSAINATGTIYQDAINQRCRMSSKATGVSHEYYDIEQLAIYRPPGAQPNTAPANLLTLFNYGPYGVEGTNFPAIYSVRTAETEFQSIYPFPAYWFGYTGSKPMIYPFWQVPYYMFANGTTTINGVKGLRYISTNTCKMSVIGVVPCITYVIAADTGVPLQTINATPRRPNSFENDHYEVMTYSNFQLGPPDESAFELPSNWTVAYRNFNNAVVIERPPGTSSSIVTATKPLNFTLRLTTVPVQALGPVTLELISAPGINYNCTSCISWSPSTFTFTTANWHTPQTLTINYLMDGSQRLNLTASGGSYDWMRPYNDVSYYLSFTACKQGTTGLQCTN